MKFSRSLIFANSVKSSDFINSRQLVNTIVSLIFLLLYYNLYGISIIVAVYLYIFLGGSE